MRGLLATWSLPWYIYVILGAFITLMLVSPKFRTESDAFLARLLGLQPKKGRLK